MQVSSTATRIRKNIIIVFASLQIMMLSIARSLVGPLVPLISGELEVGLDFIGSAISLSIFAMFFASLITGNLIELIGLKKVFFLGLVVSIAGVIMLYFSYYFSVFIIAYFLLQMGIGIVVVGNLSIVGNLYSGARASSLLKINMGNTAAFILAPLLASIFLFLNIGWRNLYIFCFVSIIGLLICLWRLKTPAKIRVESNIKTLFKANKRIISHPGFVLCGMIAFFYVPVMNTFFMWFTSYFENINIGIDISSLFLSIFGLAIFAGMIIRDRIIRHFNEKKILLIGFIMSFLTLIGVWLMDDLILKNIFIFLFGIGIAGNFSITFSISSGLFPEYANAASGLMQSFATLGLIVFQYLSGYMSEYYSKSSVLYINIAVLFVLIILTLILIYHRKFKSA
ncbi:MAG: MFS transporter [Actinobacteria bacterium]|nr:MFS transporter [Actinomycetota bacterium]